MINFKIFWRILLLLLMLLGDNDDNYDKDHEQYDDNMYDTEDHDDDDDGGDRLLKSLFLIFQRLKKFQLSPKFRFQGCRTILKLIFCCMYQSPTPYRNVFFLCCFFFL